jgi:hypothetical protein
MPIVALLVVLIVVSAGTRGAPTQYGNRRHADDEKCAPKVVDKICALLTTGLISITLEPFLGDPAATMRPGRDLDFACDQIVGNDLDRDPLVVL